MISRRQFCLGSAAACPGLARDTGFAQIETTEVAWILAGLSPLGRGSFTLRRDTAYWRAAETWFSRFTTYPAVAMLGDSFNLPRLIANAANYRFRRDGQLMPLPDIRPLWDDAAGDLFTRNLGAIESFARRSRARAFLASQRKTLQTIRETFAAAADLRHMQTWLDAQFTARPARMTVFVSPVTGGWNFTNLDPITPRLWVAAVDRPASAYERLRVARLVFAEVDHNYVNPATARLGESAYGFCTAANGWASVSGWEDYPSAELVVNEYLTFAVFVAYARDRLEAGDFQRIQESTQRMMESRGFPRFAAVIRELLALRAEQPDRIETLLPKLLGRLSRTDVPSGDRP